MFLADDPRADGRFHRQQFLPLALEHAFDVRILDLQAIIVDNKAGANGNLGAERVAKSAPDGDTMLLCDTGALASAAIAAVLAS